MFSLLRSTPTWSWNVARSRPLEYSSSRTSLPSPTLRLLSLRLRSGTINDVTVRTASAVSSTSTTGCFLCRSALSLKCIHHAPRLRPLIRCGENGSVVSSARQTRGYAFTSSISARSAASNSKNNASTSTVATDLESYRNLRLQQIEQLRQEGNTSAYSTSFQPRHTIKEIAQRFDHLLAPKEKLFPRFIEEAEGKELSPSSLSDEPSPSTESAVDEDPRIVSVAGRIVSKRESGKNLVFYTIERAALSGVDGNGGDEAGLGAHKEQLQVMAVKRWYNYVAQEQDGEHMFRLMNGFTKPGDIIGVRGFVGKTGTGELSVIPLDIHILAPCLLPLPAKETFTQVEERTRQRHLDLLVNPTTSYNTFMMRSRIVQFVRDFFVRSHSFVEVETPVLSTAVGGASATPFTTKSTALGDEEEIYMRIAPELFLKRLVVGGMERVFEIGKQFRNEGMDSNHNPEFTTCEAYQAYASYEDMMTMTEELLSSLACHIHGGPIVRIPLRKSCLPTDADDASPRLVDVDFSPPFRRISLVEELERKLGVAVPVTDTEETALALRSICTERNIEVTAPFTVARLLDRLVSVVIEPECVHPTFLMHHPVCASPLAKSTPENPELTQRFELLVGGQELCNAYSELNEPEEQKRRFQQQMKARMLGDEEEPIPDQDFVKALEYGLPPTAGWGLGIDRLVMMLTGREHIRDVILFPPMKRKKE
eukprot:TRINITY_DN14718_c0_g1_i1.p1 TRINITY_DN14718_c0_g1~~TRINITY_DN14718_c0_g1_i1.p1  ORF type:complete len:708 (+),score=106.42 TRINITY_DN14718_c0_g1_i1:177-2300(+)